MRRCRLDRKCRVEGVGEMNSGLDSEMSIGSLGFGCLGSKNVDLKVGFEKCRFGGLGSKNVDWKVWVGKCRFEGLGSKIIDWKVWVREMSIGSVF